jgi:bacterioferritin
MQGNKQVIELLNKQLCLELTSMDQYLAHSKLYEGYWRINNAR